MFEPSRVGLLEGSAHIYTSTAMKLKELESILQNCEVFGNSIIFNYTPFIL
jgi:hypothetical protein